MSSCLDWNTATLHEIHRLYLRSYLYTVVANRPCRGTCIIVMYKREVRFGHQARTKWPLVWIEVYWWLHHIIRYVVGSYENQIYNWLVCHHRVYTRDNEIKGPQCWASTQTWAVLLRSKLKLSLKLASHRLSRVPCGRMVDLLGLDVEPALQ